MAIKTVLEWTQDIISITVEIRNKFPELSKYIEEMPVKLSNNTIKDRSQNNMKEYFESLEMLMKKYEDSHKAI